LAVEVNVPVIPVAPLPAPPSSPKSKPAPLKPDSPVANGNKPVEGTNAVDRLDTLVKGDGSTASGSSAHNNSEISLKGEIGLKGICFKQVSFIKKMYGNDKNRNTLK
jgi:hypothetical protein